ncbi:MAG: protein translocase subunit SecF [Deltaproteobacteria bacterium]|nr:protein translocase subunit SecF [Deltaproteobacteria bacterium]
MQFIKPGTNIDFIGKRKIAFFLSLLCIIVTIVLLIWRGGPNRGVDFTGGILMQVTFDQQRSPAEIKAALAPIHLDDSIIQEFGEVNKYPYTLQLKQKNLELNSVIEGISEALSERFDENVVISGDATGETITIHLKLHFRKPPSEIESALKPLELEDLIIESLEPIKEYEYLIRVRETDTELTGLGEEAKKAMTAAFGQGIEVTREEMVGPKVGADLQQKAMNAIFYAILFIAVYISGRFELKWLMSIIMAIALIFAVYIASAFGVSTTWLILVALLVTIGLCWFLKLKYAMGAILALIHDVTITVGAFALTNREISLAIIAALLTIVGYSLNDTIVVFDRIRENLKRYRKEKLEDVLNSSINETLSRTILTSGTTLIVVIALYLLGGGVIHDFAFALLIGIIVGTYSSIFVASPIILVWEHQFSGKKKSTRKK